MAERKAGVVPNTAAAREEELRAQAEQQRPAQVGSDDESGEWDGTGSRLQAVREGKVDVEAVQGGLTTVAFADADLAKTEDHTGRYIAVTPVGKPKGTDKEPVKLTAPGDPVEGLSEDEIRPLLISGAVRRETKEEAKDRKDGSK
jgi:hypothetical protein